MSKDLPINLDNTNDIYRRQASLGGNKITRSVDNTEGNTTLVWGRVTQVYYQKGTCDFKIQGQSNIFVDNSGSDGTLSAPIPVDYYGKNYDGHPFIKTRLIQKGNKVLVAFVNGSTANPVILGVYPDNSESYELLSPALDNKISDNTEDTNYRVNNELEITPANQMIYKSGDGSWAKSMQGRSFLIVQGNKNFELEKISSCYENIPYFYKDNASDEPVNYPTPVYSENTKAPEWLLVHEGNWELDGSSDKHRTRFYVNQEGELQIVFFTLDKPEELLVVDGNKDTGFTIMKQFDSDTPMDKNSKNYVKFNVGDNNEISMSVSPSTDSKEQAQSLEIKSDGIYVNGKLLTSLVGGNQGDSDINVDDVKDIINSTTGIEDWDKFKDSVHKAAQDAQQAADEAKKAGDEADAAGQDAAQAGLDAKLAGENAAQKVSDLKDKMLYYLSLSPEKDMYVPGKYLILNEDVTIKNGFIKEGYIDDAAINSASIKDAAITSAKIKDLAVYNAKIANAAITNAKIADLSVGTAKIRDLAVTDEKVGKLTFNHMIGETLDANLINVTNLTADSIKAHSITADKITIGNLGELSPNLGNITGGSIDAGNVNIDNLPADDPNILTPDKKAKLRNTVDTLQEAVKAQNDFQNSVGAPSDTCNTLNMNMSKLIADTTPLLRDMNSNSEYDHKLIDNDIDNVNIELNNLSHKAITTIGKTADGKNTIYTGAFAPSNPHIGDIWAKPSDGGSNEGTFEIYGQSGWFSPTKDVYNRVQSQINNLPKSYYQGNEPTGDIATGSIWYKTKQDAMGNISFDMYVYQDGKWVAYNDSAIEGLNAKINQVAQTADGKNSIYSSSTAPTNPKTNDIWIDTGNGNAIKVYINDKWVSPNANQEQINQQITDAFQNVPSVYYQSTQPTGTINEGSTWYKTGNNNTYTMYTYKNGQWVGLLDDNIDTAIDNTMNSLQQAGANLVVNSDFSQGTYGWDLPSDGSAKVSDDLFKGHKYVTINKSGVSGTPFYWISQQDEVPVTPGESLSFSAWVKHTGLNPNGALLNINWYADATSSRNGWYSTYANSTNDSDWEFYKVEDITVPSNAQYARFAFVLPANGTVSYALPMLVHGSTVPSWAPSPADSASVSKVGQVQNSVNTANNNISSLQDNVNTINQQLKDQQNQIKGVTTVNYVPNSTFVTDPQSGLAQTFQKPLLWKEFGNAQMRIADWGGQPAFMRFYNDWGAHSVRLDLDYADCIINGWVDGSTGDTKSSSGDVNGLINRLITVVPGDTLHLENDNVDQLSTGTNNIAWYDQEYNYLCTTNIPGMSKNSAYVQDVVVPYKACYAKIGMVGIPKGTKNTWGITYKFKNMAGRGTIISNNPTEDSGHWTKVGSGSGTVTQFNNLSNAPRGTNSGMRLVTTWNNYQNTGMRTNLTGLTRGKVYMISFYAYATSGGGTIRMVTPDQSSIQIIPNTQTWYPIEFSFIASDTNQWLDLYTDAPNETIYITCINISGCDSNADRLSDKVTGMATLNNWGVQGSTVSVSDNQMLGENIIVLAPNGRTSNQMTYNNDLIENRVYVAKFWAKSDSGSNTLHMEMYGGHFDKDVNIPSGSNWTYVEFPFVYSSSTSTNTFRQNGSQRSFYLYNKGTASNVQVAGFGIYDYDSDVPKEGYFEDNRYGQIDASSAVYGATSAKDAYVRVWRNGTPSYYPATSRGTTVTEFDDTLKYVGQKAFDTYDTNNCTDLVNYLNGLNSTHIVAITTSDANTLDSNFQTWLENHNVPTNLIQSYNQQRVRMAFVGTIDRTRSYWVFPTQFALEGNYTKYQPNTFGGTVSAHLRHNQTGSAKCYKFHTYPVTPKSWVEFTWRDTPDFDNVVFLNNSTGLIQNIGSNVPNLHTVSMYALDQEAFTLTGSSWANIGAYVEPFDVAPHVSTGTIPVVTSTHTSRVQASGSAAYSNQQAVYLEVGHDSTFDKSTKVLFNGAGQDGYSLQNYLVDGMSDDLGWAKPIRITYTPPVTGKAFNNNNSGIIYVTNTGTEMRPVVTANQMLTITQSSIDYIPAYQPNTSGLVNNSVQISQSYNGVTIDDKDGITINAGNNRISLNANVGIDIYGNRQHNMKLDTNGNLIMRGNLVAGNISGVNIGGVTFKGNDMNLTNVLNVNGAIKSNGVTIDSNGLHVTKGDITLGDTNGTVYTQLTNRGTLIAKSATISGTLTSNNVNITGGSINLVKPDGNVAFHVDSTGNAVFSGNLSGVNIMGNNSTLSGMLAVNGTISAASGNVIMNNDGLTINKGSINIGNGNGTTFMVKSDGSLLSNNATITGDLTARKLTIASNADVSINVNGQFKVDRDGNVYAGSLTLKNGTINSSNMYGSSIIGSTLKLADTYLNEFYDTQLSRTQYDEYGLRSGYTLKGVNMNRHGVVTHAAGVRERSMNYLAMALSGQGWLDSNGNVHSSSTDIYTLKIQQLLALNDILHIRFTNGPSNVFTNGGTRRIIFYDSNNNVISSYESGSNSIDVTPPPNATGFKLCVYVGNNGYNNWLNAIRYSELTNTGNYMDTEDSVIAWQGDSSNPGYDICSFNYGTTDASQLNVTRDNMWITALQLDSSQLSDGDIIKLEMEINYDNSYYKPGGQFWLSVNGKSMNDSNPYFGSTNLKYAVVGNYKYVWYFTYHSDLGNHIILNLNMQGMQSGSRFYITDTKEVLHSTRNPNYYGTNNITEGAMNVITQDGKIRQTYDIYQTDGNIINSRMRDVQQSNGYFTLQAQSRLYNTNNGTVNNGYNDFSAIYMSGDGLSFVGDFNKHYVEPFMYSGALTASSDDKWQGGAAITLWGNISHETLLEHDFQYELGSGLVIDIWGDFHLMYSSVSWNVNDTRGVAMLSLDQRYNDIMMGNMFGANVPGVNPNDYSNGNNHIFKFEGSNGHITLGRMWMSTFGDPSVGDVSYVNANVSFNLVGDGWFCFQKGIATYDGTVHTISDKNTKYDIELLDKRKSIQAIQNTDFARFHYKSQHNRAESYQKGVIIDNSNEYSVDNSFVDDNGKTLNIMNLVATLADVVKEQQKQISELNAKVAYLEINK